MTTSTFCIALWYSLRCCVNLGPTSLSYVCSRQLVYRKCEAIHLVCYHYRSAGQLLSNHVAVETKWNVNRFDTGKVFISCNVLHRGRNVLPFICFHCYTIACRCWRRHSFACDWYHIGTYVCVSPCYFLSSALYPSTQNVKEECNLYLWKFLSLLCKAWEVFNLYYRKLFLIYVYYHKRTLLLLIWISTIQMCIYLIWGEAML